MTAVRKEPLADLRAKSDYCYSVYAFSSLRLSLQSFVIALGSLWPFTNKNK